ncbi:MAG: cation transporter [Candidatus Omnitrophica bacterium]|nr:cation transporter [Candidatus Omnitrophota bacterium]
MSSNDKEHQHEHHSHSDHSKHEHEQEHGHGHTHGVIDPSILSTDRGIWAVKWSFVGLAITALLQLVVVFYSGSIALLADTIHNIGDAATAIPLWIAFAFAKLKPSKRFTYGYGRIEDLAGVTIVLIILASAVVAGYESVNRLLHPQIVKHLPAVIAAALIGFLGNEAVAIFRIKTGKEIGSAALIADGYHARVDGFTSLSVLFGAIGVWLGFPLADPIIGLLITIAILKIVWDSAKAVFLRVLDGIEPEVIEEIRHAAAHVPQVKEVTEIRARWIGHRIHAELNVAVDSKLSVEEGHNVAKEVKHQLLHHLNYLSNAVIHIDPLNASGEIHHEHGTQGHDHH